MRPAFSTWKLKKSGVVERTLYHHGYWKKNLKLMQNGAAPLCLSVGLSLSLCLSVPISLSIAPFPPPPLSLSLLYVSPSLSPSLCFYLSASLAVSPQPLVSSMPPIKKERKEKKRNKPR